MNDQELKESQGESSFDEFNEELLDEALDRVEPRENPQYCMCAGAPGTCARYCL